MSTIKKKSTKITMVKNVPKFRLHYDAKEHIRFPHVVKFSGGRSSGMMLVILLENNILKPERGDVVLFNNTSAEHPATYDFVVRMKKYVESKGVPFFINEFQTYETVVRGDWKRRPSYRLAKPYPLSDKHPDGYSNRGEVFEESLAWSGMVPTIYERTCTIWMKMFPTQEFLGDWFARKSQIEELGHCFGKSKMDIEEMHKEHLKNRGKMSEELFKKRRHFLLQRPTFRPEQFFNDYSTVSYGVNRNTVLNETVIAGKSQMSGDSHTQFITLLGFRGEEDNRYKRMLSRNEETRSNYQPDGEYSYAPLYNLKIDQNQVLDFWKMQSGRIKPKLPANINLSNCVYCFLKGYGSLSEIATKKKVFEDKLPPKLRAESRKRKTPNNLSWWKKMEEQYRRPKPPENGELIGVEAEKEGQYFGFFGLGERGYDLVQKRAVSIKRSSKSTNKADLSGKDTGELAPIPCDCTD